jgi:hypothetical protein
VYRTDYLERMARWQEDGFVVLEGAAPEVALSAYDEELEAARDRLLVRAPGDEHPSLAVRSDASQAGAVDPYAVSHAARELLLSDAVIAAATEVLGATPLLFDATEAAAGSPGPGPFRDTTYVAAAPPDALLGLAVAQADGVRLTAWAGSHRLEPELFSGRYHHHNPERDGEDAVDRHRERLAAALEAEGHDRREVELRAGDVVLWHGLLARETVHGRALVAHLLPAHGEPGWFAYRPQRSGRAPYGIAWLASQHYDLDEAVAEPPPAPPAPAHRPDVARVEDALERRDAGDEGPRRAGLAGAVRGLMGRRGRS